MSNENKLFENVLSNFKNTLSTASNQTKINEASDIAALSKFELLEFNHKNAKLWVVQIDYMLAMHSIKAQRSKFNAFISAFLINVLKRVADLLFSRGPLRSTKKS